LDTLYSHPLVHAIDWQRQEEEAAREEAVTKAQQRRRRRIERQYHQTAELACEQCNASSGVCHGQSGDAHAQHCLFSVSPAELAAHHALGLSHSVRPASHFSLLRF
jgi:hypothetical protein